MSEQHYPQNGPEFISANEESEDRYFDEQLLESYNTAVEAFRGTVLSKLNRHDAIQSGYGWALFAIEPDDDLSDIDSDMRCESREILLMTEKRHVVGRVVDGEIVPSIRIMTNDIYTNGDRVELFTQDVKIDDENDAHYFVDVIRLDDIDELDEEVRTREEVMRRESISPIFEVDEKNELSLRNVMPFILGAEVTDSKSGLQTIPFGHYKELETKIYAFHRATELLTEVVAREPQFVRQKHS